MYENRKYLILPVSELPKVNFSQIMETSVQTIRKSVDGSKTFIKWDGDVPDFISNITGIEGPYSYSQILVILETPEWFTPQEE